ncbi:MAG: bifunctional demethylmenaquinone methyltransferase/2-methoxy-6-polyprenyl-1,4-benzoquinol methylase UbiE [Fimbriimonadaceae bacterium]|nr:MAG: bifunctional demethylmenaquinone methyltransferase/2-methoxy-6-polyprenyl-1,4-benzoquinol methylase UbiE [Fimbriimonadaceae bacterium]
MVESGPRADALEKDRRQADIREMFGRIAPKYDRLNFLLSFSLDRSWRSRAVEQLALSPGDSVLDVCCGTGDFLLPLLKAVGEGGNVVGVDFSFPMLRLAGGKVRPRAALGLADARRLPFQSASFNAVTMGWGLRNVVDRDAALREVCRVLKPGGRFVCLDMAGRSEGKLDLPSKVFHWASPALGRIFGEPEAYRYLPESTRGFPTPSDLAEEFRRAGFDDVRVKTVFVGVIAMHLGVKR